MTLKLYNTLTRSKDEFTPADAGNVKMYVCGPTVYARPHIGNARSVVVYDVLYRLLKHLYPNVTYVRNITDVDDKINAAAIERGISIQALTSEVTQWFHDDMDALGCLRPTHEPRATQHIQEMIKIIEALIKNGHAYVAQGHVLFDVTKKLSRLPRESGDPENKALDSRVRGKGEFEWRYGMLSGRVQDDLEAGSRVKVESYKKNASDFVLWKPTDSEDDPSSVFDSPWGKGRPGWHIECSAMSSKYLGNDFDIHGGGADLMFPHHENEIAQSCCAHPGTGYAKVWVHNGFLTVNGEKMSKSLGNFITVRDLLDRKAGNDSIQIKKWGEIIRYAFLKTKYNEPLDWNDKLLSDAKKELDYFYRALSGYKPFDEEIIFEGEELDILQDNLNTPALLRELHGIASDIHNKNVNNNENSISQRQWKMKCIGELLGLFSVTSEQWAKGLKGVEVKASAGNLSASGDATAYITGVSAIASVGNLSARGDVATNIKGVSASTEVGSFSQEGNKLDPLLLIESLITARTAAKNSKNWKEADRIRDELKVQGIILEDKPDGTTDWRRA